MSEIRFCENNAVHGTDQLSEKLAAELEDVDVIVETCLGYCGDCAEGPFALVNDELSQAETAEDLYEKIIEEI